MPNPVGAPGMTSLASKGDRVGAARRADRLPLLVAGMAECATRGEGGPSLVRLTSLLVRGRGTDHNVRISALPCLIRR